ncbi:Hypothetical predicted protein [Pelobates cultripes]|uniref:Uncharacterized protein n=1 Tax=Pelobates cultripes TaxID=61616 RepID=A0AAD1WDC7_PELCU|nr:Hypothetical predicted protein [Pelobates cultripes]
MKMHKLQDQSNRSNSKRNIRHHNQKQGPTSKRGNTRRGQKGHSHWTQRKTPYTSITPVFNLSDRPLSDKETDLFSKGMSFMLTTPPYKFQWEIDS